MPKKLTRKRVSKKKRTQKRKIQRRQRGGEYSGYLQATKVRTAPPDSMTDKLSEPDSIPTVESVSA
jgi:hypothetical protein